MSKTELTKEIENKLKIWQPKKLNNFEIGYYRQQYADFEVPVSHGAVDNGIVDFVWCAEGFINHKEIKFCRCSKSQKYLSTEQIESILDSCGCMQNSEEILKSMLCMNQNCDCDEQYVGIEKENSKTVICIEIKVTVSDFHSSHGHNFVGNLNYYIVPSDIALKIEQEVPDDIGLLVYNGSQIRIKKECAFKEIGESDYTWFLLSIVNKRDKFYNKQINKLREQCYSEEQKTKSVCRSLIDTIRNEKVKPDCFIPCIFSKSCKTNGCKNIECIFRFDYPLHYLENL